MVDVATFAAAAKVLGQARGFLRELQQGKLSEQHQMLVQQALDVVSDASDRLYQIQTEQLALSQQNAELSKRLAEVADWKSRIAQYELVKAPGGGVVYRSNSGVEHYACPSCAETDEEIHPLQDYGGWDGTWKCPGCDNDYAIAPPQSTDPNESFR